MPRVLDAAHALLEAMSSKLTRAVIVTRWLKSKIRITADQKILKSSL